MSICAFSGCAPPPENLLAVKSRSESFRLTLAISRLSPQVPFAFTVIAVPAGLLTAFAYATRSAVRSVLTRNRELADRAARRPAHRYGIGNRKCRRNMRSDVSQGLDAVEQDRIELQLEIDRNSGRVEDALSQQRPELARRLDILLVAGEGEFRRDVEGRARR